MVDPRIPNLTDIEVLPPGTPGIPGWQTVGDINIWAKHDRDTVHLRYTPLTEAQFPNFRMGDREEDNTLPFICGTACVIFEYEGRWRLGTAEQLRGLTNDFGNSERDGCSFPAEHIGMHLGDLDFRPQNGAIIGFVITRPSHYAPNEPGYWIRSLIAFFEWGDGVLRLVAVEGQTEPPPPGNPCAAFADAIDDARRRHNEDVTEILQRMRK